MPRLVHPMRLDPTQTVLQRHRFLHECHVRFDFISAAIQKVVVDLNQFAIKTAPVTNAKFEFETDDDRLAAFNKWLKSQIHKGLLSSSWSDKYIESTYKQARSRAFDKVRPYPEQSQDFHDGAKDTLLGQMGAGIEREQLQKLYTRSFDNLKAITPEMSDKMSEVFGAGLANGLDPQRIARELVKEVDIDKRRAERIARTEIVHANSEGMLDTFEQLEVEGVNVEAEILTSGDACDECDSLTGETYSIDEARGLIPVHPNCQCSWIPVV